MPVQYKWLRHTYLSECEFYCRVLYTLEVTITPRAKRENSDRSESAYCSSQRSRHHHHRHLVHAWVNSLAVPERESDGRK